MRELLSVGVFTGYYAGYYNPLNKHRKSPLDIINKMFASKKRSARNKPDVDVEAFKALEQAFERGKALKGVVRKGGF